MKRLINHMKRLFVKGIKKVPVGVGTELIVQMENVYEEVKTHKKIKKHHRRNKQPAWFKEFVDTVFLPTIARIETTLAEHTALLSQHSKDIAEIKVTLAEHTALLSQHSKDIAEIKERLDRNNIF
ncbi:MAG: hypothetical protein LBH55_00425 [Mycoplasmataceae bacterium]|nr:hypothetical protein [Mycoplasmataceae bacterium]